MAAEEDAVKEPCSTGSGVGCSVEGGRDTTWERSSMGVPGRFCMPIYQTINVHVVIYIVITLYSGIG